MPCAGCPGLRIWASSEQIEQTWAGHIAPTTISQGRRRSNSASCNCGRLASPISREISSSILKCNACNKYPNKGSKMIQRLTQKEEVDGIDPRWELWDDVQANALSTTNSSHPAHVWIGARQISTKTSTKWERLEGAWQELWEQFGGIKSKGLASFKGGKGLCPLLWIIPGLYLYIYMVYNI